MKPTDYAGLALGLATAGLAAAWSGSTVISSSTQPGFRPQPHRPQKGSAAALNTPFAFEANAGQAHAAARFTSGGPGYRVFLSDAATATLALEGKKGWTAVRLGPAAPRDARPRGEKPLGRATSYFRAGRVTRAPQFATVRYPEVYPGVDLLYYGRPVHGTERLEYDWVVKPGADPSPIRMRVEGADLSLNQDGSLNLRTEDGAVRQHAPVIYQEREGRRIPVSGRYELASARGEFGFRLGNYDPTLPLIIDPVIDYASYLGGEEDESAYDIAVDSQGRAVVTGVTDSVDFPLTPGPFGTDRLNEDAFVVKFNATGTDVLFSAILGGSSRDIAQGVALDGNGNIYLAGRTSSWDFPTVQPIDTHENQSIDAWVAKLSSDGSTLLFSTYLSGDDQDGAQDIALDGNGNILVTGYTDSDDFPTVQAAQPNRHSADTTEDIFITKIDGQSHQISFSTYLGGSGSDARTDTFGKTSIAADPAGNIVVSGETNSRDFPTTAGVLKPTTSADFMNVMDAFVARYNPQGQKLWATYLGGNQFTDAAYGVAADAQGNVYVCGVSISSDFPTTPQAFKKFGFGGSAFLSKINPSGSAFVYSTFLDQTQQAANAVVVDAQGHAFVCGNHMALSGLDTTNGFVARMNPQGSQMLWWQSIGGTATDLARSVDIDPQGIAYVCGETVSTDFPVTAGAWRGTHTPGFNDDGWVARVRHQGGNPDPDPDPDPTPSGKLKCPARVNLGAAKRGTPKLKSITVQNAGKTPLSGTVVGPDAPFILVSGGGAFQLPPKGKFTITLQIESDTPGTIGDDLVIQSSDPARPVAVIPVTAKVK